MQGNTNAEKLALVLPGKLDTKDYPHMRSHVDFLAKKGYLALSFDPPGTWESPGDIALYTTSNYLNAINELIEHFGNRPTLVVGHSRGGGMATLAGVTNPYITHFVSLMGFYSFTTSVHGAEDDEIWKQNGHKLSKRDIPGTDPVAYREYVLPYTFLEDEVQYDMSEALGTCTKPKLFVLGKEDVLVPPEIVKTGFNLSAEPKELYELGYGHDYRRSPKHIEEVNVRIEKFLEKYNI